MKNFVVLSISLSLLFSVFMIGGMALPSTQHLSVSACRAGSGVQADESYPRAVCFAPGTPDSYMREWEQRIQGRQPLDYNIVQRWTSTATDGTIGPVGTGCHLTYSFIPDGTMINGQPSQLFQMLNQQFGSQDVWQNLFAEAFAEWEAVSGLRYAHETNDDGATFVSSPGVLGVRGDIRIGSIPVDGPSGILAYNYYPDAGDMVLDASEAWGSHGNNYIFFRNIVAHELGHGWGVAHVCPINSTKLLEPYYSSAFDGPQNDDIRAVQASYGDTYQPNYTASTAYPLGVMDHDTVIASISLRSETDQDYFKFRIPAGKGMTLSLVPVGSAYLDGTQNQDGSCNPGTLINSMAMQDLDLFLLNSTGQTELARSNTHPAGESEQVFRYAVPVQGDSFIAEVTGGISLGQQIYSLHFEIFNLADPYLSFAPLVFDTTNLGAPLTLSPQLINPWNLPLQVLSITATSPFTVTPSAPFTIPPNGSVAVSVTFPGSPLGLQTGVLTINHSGPSGTLTTDLWAMAITTGLAFPSGQAFSFGDVPLNTTSSMRIPIRATGNAPVTVLSISAADPFSVAFDGPVTLNPGQAFLPWIHCHPNALGPMIADMIITHTGTSSPDTVTLSGVGVAPQTAGETVASATEYRLEQNYPNPFNPSTEIRFELAKAGSVQLAVYNRTGQLVALLLDGTLSAGSHVLTWNGRAGDGSSVASGLYLYRIKTESFTDTKKMLLMR